MLRNAKDFNDLAVRATDGELGILDQLYFDDETWTIRYLTVETGWSGGRLVRISPISIVHANWQDERLDVALTKKQVENSPDIDTNKPASMEAMGNRIEKESTDSHLRGARTVTGYHIEASDGELGHVDGFILDDETWAIRYIEVATTPHLWQDKKVLISPAWIERISWTDSKVYLGLTREAIQNAPDYLESFAITREYENRLYMHYGRPPYWLHEAEHQPSLSLSGA